MKQRLVILSICTSFLIGCASAIKVQPVSPQNFAIDRVCIEKNPGVSVEDFLSVLQAGMQRHHINSEVFTGDAPETCQYRMTYKTRHSWDVSPYLSYVKLDLFDGSGLIGNASYEYSGSSISPDLTKWGDTASKIDPMIDKLFAGY